MSSLVDGRRIYAFTVEEAIRRAREWRPWLVFLDAGLGFPDVRAVEAIPWLLEAAPRCLPVLLLSSPRAAQVGEALALGAYAWADFSDPGFEDRVDEIIWVGRQSVPRGAHHAARRAGGGGLPH